MYDILAISQTNFGKLFFQVCWLRGVGRISRVDDEYSKWWYCIERIADHGANAACCKCGGDSWDLMWFSHVFFLSYRCFEDVFRIIMMLAQNITFNSPPTWINFAKSSLSLSPRHTIMNLNLKNFLSRREFFVCFFLSRLQFNNSVFVCGSLSARSTLPCSCVYIYYILAKSFSLLKK